MLEWKQELTCPYCGADQTPDYGMPDITYPQECSECGKDFIVHTLMTTAYATTEVK